MPYSRYLVAALFVGLWGLAGCSSLGGAGEPDGHGPGWIQRPAEDLIPKVGPPDRKVRLPPPQQVVVWLYTGGATPGFAVCERNYYVRGGTVIGYREHGADPTCKRSAGRFDD